MPHYDNNLVGKRNHNSFSYIIMVPLAREGAWVFVYNSKGDDVLVHIPFGLYFVLRDDVMHGGWCGSSGNTRLQISFIYRDYLDNFRYLQYINEEVALAKGYFHPPPIDYNKAEGILPKNYEHRLGQQMKEMEEEYWGMENFWPSLKKVYEE